MKICLVHGSVTKHRGSGRYVFDLATRFAEDGASVTLLCHECDEDIPAIAGITVLQLPRLRGEYGLWRLGHLAGYWALKQQIPRLLAGCRFDALMGSDLLFLSPCRKALGHSAKFIYTPLSMIAPLEIASYNLGGIRHVGGVRLFTYLQRWALSDCDVLVRFTKSAVQALEKYYDLNLQGKSVEAVYVSREFDDSQTAQLMNFARPSPRELLWVGGLIKSKNVDFLLRSSALLTERDWLLNICSDGPERQRLESIARSLGIDSRICFRGIVTDLAGQYLRASMLLAASVLEQYSLTLMEAYAFGVPCIGLKPDWKTVYNSNEDQIRHGETGFLVRDEAEMADRIDYLLTHEDERQMMGRNGYEMKKRGFSFESFYTEIKQLLVS